MVPERQAISVRIANRIVAQPVRPILRWIDDLDARCLMKSMQLVCVAHHEVDGAALWTGRALLEKHLDVAEIHTGEDRRVTFRERQPESELRRVEVDGGANVSNGQRRMVFLAIDV